MRESSGTPDSSHPDGSDDSLNTSQVMERVQLWRRVWLRLQRKSHSRTYTMATRTRSAPERGEPPPARYTLGRRHFSFFSLSVAAGVSLRPKCLLDVDCTNLLMGGSNQYEDFSSTCWLENHLHRFGSPSLPQVNSEGPSTSNNREGSSFLEPTASSSAGDTSDDVQSVDSADSVGSGSGNVEFHNNLNGDNGSVINLHRYPYIDPDLSVVEPVQPPPYADEPPPTYEEAVAGNSLFDDICDNSDFLW
ncbi:hypothetical protein BaRGS_00014917 [Batillaria attramentaria]|uniref:Uncharacterized protein n=1 Tax=Batillaria attramentaria TaxID=370345 RepID=A0ABD0L3F0_9CAEN